jgi:hypothetical protein
VRECTKRPAALRVIHFRQKVRSSPLIAVSAAAAAAMPEGNISSQHTLRVNIAAWGRARGGCGMAARAFMRRCVCVCLREEGEGEEYLLHI